MERPVAVALSLIDRILAARFTTISCDRQLRKAMPFSLDASIMADWFGTIYHCHRGWGAAID
ncbi:MAG: hypothetical protein VB853_01330, partial [Pirellulales bacterium]